jgi:hypothetical protein
MIVLFTMTYPTTSAVEFAKVVVKNFQEHPLPDFMKMIGSYTAICEDGGKTYAIIDIEKGQEDEAFKIVNKRLKNYLPIPGFGWKEERLLDMQEGLALAGLDGP